MNSDEEKQLQKERSGILQQLEDWLETPMLVLGFVWLGLLVIELTYGLNRSLELLGILIWVIFVFDFLLKWMLAPQKGRYLRHNWLTLVSLLIPALRVFRIFRAARLLRAARAARGMRLIRVVSSLNRGMRALASTMKRRGFGYVLGLTLIINVAGAAGMYAFENSNPDGRGLNSYGAALWWTAMILTTMGSEYWPQTPEGRTLCLLLAIYAFAVFGYVTASIASFFVGRDAEDEEGSLASAATVKSLHEEISSLREELRSLIQHNRNR